MSFLYKVINSGAVIIKAPLSLSCVYLLKFYCTQSKNLVFNFLADNPPVSLVDIIL